MILRPVRQRHPRLEVGGGDPQAKERQVGGVPGWTKDPNLGTHRGCDSATQAGGRKAENAETPVGTHEGCPYNLPQPTSKTYQ